MNPSKNPTVRICTAPRNNGNLSDETFNPGG
jgi:hypothetical protein